MADLEAHSQFALFLFYGLPAPAQSEDVNRLTLAYFLISSLDLLHSLSHIDAKQVIDWVYGHQVLPATNFHDSGTCFMGFRGSLSAGVQFSPLGASALVHDGGHLASTYSALAILTILGDDLCRVRKHALLVSMRKLQQQDGSFTSVHMGMEADLSTETLVLAFNINAETTLETLTARTTCLPLSEWDVEHCSVSG
ncbi:hypothetical protein L7F22_058080 [Adiantum nelumboides]|nr:hypothetical protein [Adiantum nelumboides]MCO5603924.1 hypothetical protein [Adiantum nelumboides]